MQIKQMLIFFLLKVYVWEKTEPAQILQNGKHCKIFQIKQVLSVKYFDVLYL